MMRRAALLLDDRCRAIKGGTFHSFANLCLRKYAAKIGFDPNFSIVDRSDAEDILNIVRSDSGYASKSKRFPKKTALLNVISKSLNTGKAIPQILERDYPQFLREEDKIAQLAEHYRRYKAERSIMDYDDLLLFLKKLLDEHADVRERLSMESRYIMIDEFQDTNTLQADIADLLASEHHNLMVVGDDSQSIYSFRGAAFRNIMDFPKRFPDCTVTRLEQNYRSTEPILAFTNALIASAEERHDKTLFSEIPSEQKPVFLRANTFDDQASFIAQHVLELREEGIPLDSMAVLFRSGWHSNELEIELAGRDIPFVKFGGMKFIETAHVKDVVSLLRVTHNPKDAIAWYRQLLLIEGIGPRTARDIMGRVIDENQGFAALIDDSMRRRKFGGQLQKLHKVIEETTKAATPEEKVLAMRKYYAPLLKHNYDDHRKRVDDLDSLERIASRYKSMQQFLDDISLEPPTHSQIDTAPEDKEDEKLVLSTIHSAKGLEWHTVFVIGLIDGYLPSAQALHSRDEIEEERRLLYVACTRAERNLFLLSPELSRSGGFSPIGPGFTFSEPSRFLSEIRSFDELVEEWMLTDEED